MSKDRKSKNSKPQTINNIQNVNMDIDYNKLAKAIVEAQNEANKINIKGSRFTLGTISALLTLTFQGTAIFGWFAAIILFLSGFVNVLAMQWTSFESIATNIATLIFAIGIESLLIIFPLLLWKSSKEVELEKDKNYLIALFSGIVSVLALIVALVK